MREPDLSHCGGGLTLLQPQRAVLQAEPAPAERNGARRHQDDTLAAFAQPQQVLDQSLEPGAVDTPAFAVHQQRRAHLHDNAPCLREGRCQVRTAGVHEENYTQSSCVAQPDRSPYTYRAAK
jgi:hypothetical protein